MNFDPNIEDLNSYMWQYRQVCKHREPFTSITDDAQNVFNKLATCNVDLTNFHIGDPWLAGVAYIDMCFSSLTQEVNALCAYNFVTLAINKAQTDQFYQLALPLRALLIDQNWPMYESVYREFVEESYKNGYQEKADSSLDLWAYPSLEKIDLLIMSDIFACNINVNILGYEKLKEVYNNMYRKHFFDFSREEIVRYGHRLHYLFSEFMINRYNPSKVFASYSQNL